MLKRFGKGLVTACKKVIRGNSRNSHRGRGIPLQRCPTVSVGTSQENTVTPRMTRSYSCPSSGTPRIVVVDTKSGVEPSRDDETITFVSDVSPSNVLHPGGDIFWILSTIAFDSKDNIIFGKLKGYWQRRIINLDDQSLDAEFNGVHESALAARDEVDLSAYKKIHFLTDNLNVAEKVGEKTMDPRCVSLGTEPIITSTKALLNDLLKGHEVHVSWIPRRFNSLADAFATRPRKALDARRDDDYEDANIIMKELLKGKEYPTHMIKELWDVIIEEKAAEQRKKEEEELRKKTQGGQ